MALGIVGGLGPMATAYFMELIVRMTKAECDQEHLEMLVYQRPSIPDRTNYILGKSTQNPLPYMIETGQILERHGVDCIAIPCITAHYFHQELEDGIGCKVIHAIRDTAATLKAAGIKRAAIMATDGTVGSGIFQKELEQAGIKPLLPDGQMQQFVMSLIYDDVKAGRTPDMEHFKQVADSLIEKGAQVIILGCTELSVIKRDYELGAGFIDALDVLAKSSIEACGKEVKETYATLFLPFGSHEDKRFEE
jgi:aspartate racemase